MILSSSRHSHIGLDVGAAAIKAVQVVHDRSGPRISAAAWIPRTQPGGAGTAIGATLSASEAARLASSLRRKGFAGSSIVISPSRDQLLTGVLELPSLHSGAPLDEIARQELARACKCDPRRLELGWWDLPSGPRASEGVTALAVGLKHEDAGTLMDALESAGLNVCAIDAAPVALARACAPMVADPPELTVVLDTGFCGAQIIIMRGRTPVYERIMREAGLRTLHAELSAKLGLDDALAAHVLGSSGSVQVQNSPVMGSDDLRTLIAAHADTIAAEIKASMSYATRRFESPVSRVLVAGGAATAPGWVERLGQRCDVQTQAARADALAAAAPGGLLCGADFVLALGLALKAGAAGGAR